MPPGAAGATPGVLPTTKQINAVNAPLPAGFSAGYQPLGMAGYINRPVEKPKEPEEPPKEPEPEQDQDSQATEPAQESQASDAPAGGQRPKKRKVKGKKQKAEPEASALPTQHDPDTQGSPSNNNEKGEID